MSNKIVIENQKQGTPQSEWDLVNGASDTIEGFTTDISYNIGQTVDFKIDTDSNHYRIDIYRLGYYGGDGARLIDGFEHVGGIDQPDPLFDATRGLVDAGNWSVTDSWQIPDDITSGVYIAKLTRLDGTEGENHIPFVVRDDAGSSEVLFQTDDTTWQAYNKWGGHSLYDTQNTVAVSYNRPFSNRFGDAEAGVAPNPNNFVFGNAYPAIRWLEANGYDVSYATGVDSARFGENLLDHKIFLSVGHDEYWSGDQRTNVEFARDSGVNLVFWTGNDVFWRTRWEEGIDGSGDDYRTMITYKTSDAFRQDDPTGDWTGLWRDPDSQYCSCGLLQPENALTGTMYMVNIDLADPFEAVEVSSDFSALRFWRHTEIANLQVGESITLPEVIGYEWNVDADNGYRPTGLIHLSATTAATSAVVTDADYIQYTLPDPAGYATHNLTMYRSESGSLVFSAASINWVWALDNHHAGTVTPTDANIQQAMINLFADMGVQPETIYEWLVQTTTSTDVTAPLVSVSNLTRTSADTGEIVMTVDGTAFDLGGGVVGGVEVSSDGGASWHLASGTHEWTYTWKTADVTSTTFLARAIDDSINIGHSTTAFSIGTSLTELSQFAGFTTTDGWNNTVHTRVMFDVDGDGIKDFVGFGDSAIYVHRGQYDANGTLSLSGEQEASITAFIADQGYTAASRRGVDYVGDFVLDLGGQTTASPVFWGITPAGINFYEPTSVDGVVSYESTARHYDWFGSEQGWSGTEHQLDFAFVSTGNTETGMKGDAFASILGFGYAGLTLAPQAFHPSAVSSDAYLVQGSEAFGFDAGWNEQVDLRSVTDFRGKEIDLNHDGILDVVGIGAPGVVYALGQQSSATGETGVSTYSLGAAIVADIDPNGGSAFNRDLGWDNADTIRMLADVNGDDQLDIVGFGDAGVYVSLGKAPDADGTGAFGKVFLAVAGYGNADGWSTATYERTLGDVNGDGLLDIVGFGETATIVSTGVIDPATGVFTWSYAAAIYDYGVSESWSNAYHMREVTDIDGNGTDEIVVSGDLALQIFQYAA